MKFRIPPLDDSAKDKIKRLVDRILVAKQRDAAVDTSELERNLKQLVYQFYGLTPEEIRIVEASAK